MFPSSTNSPPGYDAPFHLAEECSNAAIASPRAIVLTSAVGGVMGWFLQLVVAYTVNDIEDAMSASQPWAGYLQQVLPQNVTLAVLALTIVCGFSMGQGCMVAASRVTFAYGRDDCFGPLSPFIKQVNPTTRTPVNAVWFNTTIGILLCLLIFGGTAIDAIFSVGAIGAFSAFTIPIFIKTFFVGNRFRRGPWHLGRWSQPIGYCSSAFVSVMIPVMCFPQYTGSDLTADAMNWTAVVYGGPMLFIITWWMLSARKWFKGPHVNVEHHMLGRDVVEGIEKENDDNNSDTPSLSKSKEAEAGPPRQVTEVSV
jgi:amino acid transporter